jgi:hypothetical protein
MDTNRQVSCVCGHVIEIAKCPRNEQVIGSIPIGGSTRNRSSAACIVQFPGLLAVRISGACQIVHRAWLHLAPHGHAR